MATGKIQENPTIEESGFGDIEKTQEPGGVPLGHRGHNGHPYTVPWGFYKLLKYIHSSWTSPHNALGRTLPIYVTENGYAEQGERQLPFDKKIDDANRVAYFEGYLDAMVKAVKEGVPVKSYMAWSLLEWVERKWANG